MKYLIIGAGGTGGCIAAYLAKANKDVTLIARGEHLKAITENGLTVKRDSDTLNVKVKATDEEHLSGKFDIIFLCVKGYSVDASLPLIKKAADENTVVIPILNIYGTGDYLRKMLPDVDSINGCIYIGGTKTGPGEITLSGSIFRIVFGRKDGGLNDTRLMSVKADLTESGIKTVYSADIDSDCFRKFAFISPMAAAGAYLNACAGDYKTEGAARDLFLSCTREVINISKAMGLNLPEDMEAKNIATMTALGNEYTASLQKDILKGGESEIDGQIFEVCRLGRIYGVQTPSYDMIAAKFNYK